jgi:membrane dipeptidase
MDITPPAQAVEILTAFRRGVLNRPDRYVLVHSAQDVLAAKRTGRLAVSFDLEGTEPLDGRIEMVSKYYELGVRTMLIAYNQANRGGGGCHDDPKGGLTAYGRAVVAEMNRLGVLVDATHCSRRTTFDLFEYSTAPVVFSHSVPYAIKKHPRNIDDDQILACAAGRGVVGINGVGLFLGDERASTDSIVRAIDYTVSLAGPQSVGLGLDYVFDKSELDQFVVANRSVFPVKDGYRPGGPWAFVNPRQLSQVTTNLLNLGYTDDAVRGILGGNFLRVASQVWKG